MPIPSISNGIHKEKRGLPRLSQNYCSLLTSCHRLLSSKPIGFCFRLKSSGKISQMIRQSTLRKNGAKSRTFNGFDTATSAYYQLTLENLTTRILQTAYTNDNFIFLGKLTKIILPREDRQVGLSHFLQENCTRIVITNKRLHLVQKLHVLSDRRHNFQAMLGASLLRKNFQECGGNITGFSRKFQNNNLKLFNSSLRREVSTCLHLLVN